MFVAIYAFVDNFTWHDHSGWAKALRAILIIFLPTSARSSTWSHGRQMPRERDGMTTGAAIPGDRPVVQQYTGSKKGSDLA